MAGNLFIPELQTIMMERVAHPGAAQSIRRQALVVLTVVYSKIFCYVRIVILNFKIMDQASIVLDFDFPDWQPDVAIPDPVLITNRNSFP